MAHIRDVYRFYNSNEYEYKYAGNYGARGEKRSPKRKASEEQIRKQNQTNRVKKVRRIIKANFQTDDLWITLKYPKGYRTDIKIVQKNLSVFNRKMRTEYKKREQDYKYIIRVEIGKRGGIHIHAVINRARGTPETDILVRRFWPHGTINFVPLYEAGGFSALAEYIVKPVPEEIQGQLDLFADIDKKVLTKYTCSRNLIRPVPERKFYSRRTVEKLVRDGPKPTDGYYVDKDSIRMGVNEYTGMSYLYYIEYKIGWEDGT